MVKSISTRRIKMNRTHLSLYYLFSYLYVAGIALLFAPQFTLKLLFSNGSYGDIMPRFVGMFLIVLGTLILQITRHHVEVLYPTVLGVRLFILVVIAGLYFYSADPLFIVLFVIVGFGVVLTALGLWLDRQRSAPATRATG
jgi:uncharacterized protein YjeT (DUF2065 family)